jgi:hypothetical protein
MASFSKGVLSGNWVEESLPNPPQTKTEWVTSSQSAFSDSGWNEKGEELRLPKASDADREQGSAVLFGQRDDWDRERFQTEYRSTIESLGKETDPFVKAPEDKARNTRGAFDKSVFEDSTRQQPDPNQQSLFRHSTDIHERTNDASVQGLRR